MRWRWRWPRIRGGSATGDGWRAKGLVASLSLTINCTCHTHMHLIYTVCVYVYMHMFTTTFCVHLYQDLWLNVTDVNIIEGCICAEAAVTPLSGLHSSSWADLRSVAECVTALCVISNLSSVLIHIAAVGVGLYSYCEAAFQCVGIRFAS